MISVSLPPELEELVNAKVQSGQYHSSGEVIREGLRLLQEKDALRQIKLEQLRKDIAIGIAAADRDELALLDVEAIIARGKQRLAGQI